VDYLNSRSSRWAFEDGSRKLSYADAGEWMRSLSGQIRGLAVDSGLLAICASSSIEVVIALLAAFESGHGFVMLDPGYPEQRSRAIAVAAQVNLLLADRGNRHIAEAIGVPMLDIALRPADEQRPKYDPGGVSDVSASRIAYISFTSGSTGIPKGTIVPYAAVANHVEWLHRRWPLQAGDRLLHLTPVTFDAALTDIFWPLRGGATIVVPGPGIHRDPALIARELRDREITVARIPPALLPSLIDHPSFAECHSLRYLLCGGEVLPAAVRDAVLRTLPGVTLLNRYGPTEATIAVTYHQCQAGDPARFVPLGEAIDDTRVVVLDEFLRPVPRGAEGEICISGAALSYGYLGNGAATAAAFRPDSSSADGTRLYRTGDRGTVTPEGHLRFIGRRDRQVKLHGLRVELGEVEVALLADPSVRQARVEMCPGPGGIDRLIAFVVPAPAAQASAGEDLAGSLRRHLRRLVPAHVVPTDIVPMAALPRDARGKVDTRALRVLAAPGGAGAHPAPRRDRRGGTSSVVSGVPVGSDEEVPVLETVRAICAQVLETEDVAAEANFFDLGGHSLLAIRLAANIRDRLGVEIPLSTIFEAETVREIGTTVARERSDVHA